MFKISQGRDGKLITLSRALDERGKYLYLIYSIMFLIAGILLGVALIYASYSLGAMLFTFIGFMASTIAGVRFGSRAFASEKIFVNKQTLEIIKISLLKNERKVYEISKISNFRHLQKPELTDHPLAGNSFDYLGFQTEQKVISEMHGDKSIAFDYEGKVITFGTDIYSWQFDELEMLLHDFSGNDLRYADKDEMTL